MNPSRGDLVWIFRGRCCFCVLPECHIYCTSSAFIEDVELAVIWDLVLTMYLQHVGGHDDEYRVFLLCLGRSFSGGTCSRTIHPVEWALDIYDEDYELWAFVYFSWEFYEVIAWVWRWNHTYHHQAYNCFHAVNKCLLLYFYTIIVVESSFIPQFTF